MQDHQVNTQEKHYGDILLKSIAVCSLLSRAVQYRLKFAYHDTVV